MDNVSGTQVSHQRDDRASTFPRGVFAAGIFVWKGCRAPVVGNSSGFGCGGSVRGVRRE